MKVLNGLMIELTKKEYNNIHKDFRSVWTNPDYPEYIGKRTMFKPGGGTRLIIEDYHFVIVD